MVTIPSHVRCSACEHFDMDQLDLLAWLLLLGEAQLELEMV